MKSERRRESDRKYDAKWYAKIRSDPERWAARLKAQAKNKAAYRRRLSDKQRERINYLQNKRRQQMSPEEREHALAKRRAAWAKIPSGDPRRKRKKRAWSAADQQYRKKIAERLPDAAVSNQYLKMRVGECPKELIALKREIIRLTRRLKNHPNNNK